MNRRGFFATLAALFGAKAAAPLLPARPAILTDPATGMAIRPVQIWPTPPKIGDTIIIRKPPRFVVRDGMAFSFEPIMQPADLGVVEPGGIRIAVRDFNRESLEILRNNLDLRPKKMRVRFDPARLPA